MIPSTHPTEITVEARPEAVAFDLARTAVLVIDMQNDFGAEGGMVHRAGGDLSLVRHTIAPTARLLDAARAAGMTVVYTQHGYLPDLSDLGSPGGKNRLIHEALNVGEEVTAPDGRASRILIHDTWNTEMVGELTPADGDVIVGKNRFSGFRETTLDADLWARGIDTLLVCGWTTSDCVEATVRDAAYRDYRAIVVADCTGETHGREFHANSLALIERMHGWVTDSASVLAALA
ncbi:cysteine hydrolase family protein [Phytomonospora endophytica]|uniref:Ureidoacrylate peracid hydrolase n=1 Tax=Phytomonospora endophytica TaxID=714109 RepID=A0A841G051_9ACTN|nr:cysteine hydrolase family protein [Phytomonospora endophytica]MBB6039152.1 ureidoacrylate peracid hydrolase [Phytomonospora endophytica]GIG67611.1 peroxyureidoacrylate/ureidoacrylate amidohydrolase RutB [Phytomonospora endophytica]